MTDPTTPPLTNPRRVLIAEDSVPSRKLLQFLLQKLNRHVVATTNGREAVEAALAHVFDVLLIDIEMPVLDGFGVVYELKSQRPENPPIVALTARDREEDRLQCLDAGFDDYLAKPVSHASVQQLLSRLGKEQPHAAAPAVTSPVVTTLCTGALFDRQHALQRAFGDEEFLTELIGVFLDSLDDQVAELEQALRSHDLAAIGDAAHAIKGSIGSFTMHGPYVAARDLEYAGRDENTAVVASSSALLRQLLPLLQQELQAQLNHPLSSATP